MNSAMNNNNSNASMQLESKIHMVAASFRQKRDEAHRSHQLAMERLRLATEECEAVAKTAQTAEANLKTIQEKAGGSAAVEQERATLQSEVAHLSKEVHFQHTELVQKRSKLVEQRESMQKAAAQRAASLNKLRALVQQRRTKVFEQHKDAAGLLETNNHHSPTAALLADEWNEDREGRLQTRWPRVIRNQGTALEAAADENRLIVLQLQRIIKGHQHMERSSSYNNNNNTAAGAGTTNDFTTIAKNQQEHNEPRLAESNNINASNDASTAPDVATTDISSSTSGDDANEGEGLQFLAAAASNKATSMVTVQESSNAAAAADGGDTMHVATTNAATEQ